mgnify:CR=1 FL=1
MTNCLEILRKSARKIRKMLEISGICEKFSFFISFFIRLPDHYKRSASAGDSVRALIEEITTATEIVVANCE